MLLPLQNGVLMSKSSSEHLPLTSSVMLCTDSGVFSSSLAVLNTKWTQVKHL